MSAHICILGLSDKSLRTIILSAVDNLLPIHTNGQFVFYGDKLRTHV